MMSGECCRAPLQSTGRAGKHSAALAAIASALTWCLLADCGGPSTCAQRRCSSATLAANSPTPWRPWVYRKGDATVSSRCSGTGPPPTRALSRSSSSATYPRYRSVMSLTSQRALSSTRPSGAASAPVTAWPSSTRTSRTASWYTTVRPA
jgi:hypothetical protein